jgi:branched-subunit amino acid aminotransferase/4-amino-4-deoxychorismate lyase
MLWPQRSVHVGGLDPVWELVPVYLLRHGTSLGSMSLDHGRYRFNGTALVPLEIDSQLALYVADSWLTREGATVALERHFARFALSADVQGLVRPVDDFLAAVRGAIPSTGDWFPRLELTVRGELQLSLRPAPELTDSVTLWSATHDPRTEPAIKGPDIAALEELRAEARAAGATEPVISSAEGFIVDGATTCLLWWHNGALYTPAHELTRVDSVTVSVLRDIAESSGVSVGEAKMRASELDGCEVWAVNALHGIRPALAWLDGPSLTVDESRLATWRRWYESVLQS